MPPIKRSRGLTSGEDGTSRQLPHPSSPIARQPRNKRQRVSESATENSDTEDATSTNGDLSRVDPEERATQERAAEELQTQGTQGFSSRRQDYVRMRDGADEEAIDEDDDERELQLTQLIRQQNRDRDLEIENPIAENGVIESVTCTNFMCHSKLTVNFGPLINFIIGHNGSGKSAVLTAITLCLGGKATSTNRGQSLKSFIKEGQESASLEVKIKNQGDNAFRQEVYGNSIIVERHFSTSGASGFKIKSASGRLISSKRSELDDMADHYNLQLDNPVNVLTQDMARQFLNNSTPSEKYKFFLKGVQLEQLDRDYLLVIESLEGADAQLENLAEACEELRAKAKEAESKLKASENQNILREKIQKYTHQMAWVQVEEQENLLVNVESDIRRTAARIAQRVEDAKPFEAEYEKDHEQYEQQNAKTAELQESIPPMEQQQEQPRRELENVDNELRETLIQQRKIHTTITERRNTTLKRLAKDIEDEERRLMDADGGAQAEMLIQIKDAEETHITAKRKLEDHLPSLPQLKSAEVEASKQAKQAELAVSLKREDVEAAEGRLTRLRQDRGRHLGAFNPNLPALLKAIQTESRFHDKPIGPMGNHIRLLKQEWSSILESYIGPALNAFVVTDKHDQTILNELMKRHKYMSPVYIGPARHIDTSDHEPDRSCDTILRALEIDSEQVRNQLLINISMEQVVLIRSRPEAQRFMFGNGRRPNVKCVLCFHEHKTDHGVRFSWGPGGQKSDPVKAWTQLPRMRTDIDAQIKMQMDNLKGFKQELGRLEDKFRTVRGEYTRCSQAITRFHRDEKDLKLEIDRASDRIHQLKDELEQAKPQDGRLESLKSDLEQANAAQEVDQGQYDESRNAMEECHMKRDELSKQIDELEKQVEKVRDKVKRSELRAKRYADLREAALVKKNKALDLVEAEKKKLEESEEERARQTEDVKHFNTEASKICERVPVDAGETGRTLDKKIERFSEELRRAEQAVGGDARTILQQAQETRRKWNQARQQKTNIESLIQVLTQATAERRDRWDHFRGGISLRARAQFRDLLEERAFRGRLVLDHRGKMLELRVEPDHTREGGTGRQTNTLSGGEKSFSTICLVLALWEAMCSPIRCLDEFDVFMDSVNRATAMRMLVAAARRSPGRQFIFITPQSMNNVDFGPDVKLHKLNDPERGQRTLDFGGAAPSQAIAAA